MSIPEQPPAAGVQLLERDWLRSADELIKCLSSIGTASRHDKARYVKLMSATLLRNFSEQLSPDDWSAAATARVPQLLMGTAIVLCGNAPTEQYWQLALQSVQTATRFFDPGERVVAEFSQHHIASLRLKIAQHCRATNQLKLMSGVLREAVDSLADQPASSEDFLAARSSCDQHALQQQQQVFSSKQMPKLQCGIALLQLFHAVNSMWPGQAGLLATPEGQEAAGPAFELAVVLLEQAAGLDRQRTGQTADPIAAAAAKNAIDATALLVRQLARRMHHSKQSMRSSQEQEQHEGFEQQLLDNPAVLHMLLLLADMHLQQQTSNGNISMSSCSDSTSRDGAETTAVQQYHEQLLLSFCGLSEQLWQGSIPAEAATAAGAHQVDLLSLLGLLPAALCKSRARFVSVGGAAFAPPDDPRDDIVCSLLSRLMSALTHTAQQQWQAGLYQLAAAAIEAVQEASKSLSQLPVDCYQACEDVIADSAPANARTLMRLAYEQQQLMPDLLQGLVSCMEALAHPASAPPAAAGSTGEAQDCDSCSSHMTDASNNPSSRADSSSGLDGLQAKLLGHVLLTVGRVSALAFADLPSTAGAAECSTSVAAPDMQLTAARVVECSMRITFQQVQAAPGGRQHGELISALAAVLRGDLCTVGVPTKLPDPAPYWLAEQPPLQCHESGSSSPVQQITAASAAQSVGACDLFTDAAHKGLFALLVSSLKMTRPADEVCVPDKVEGIVGVLINDAVKARQQAAQGAPLASLSEVQAAPWLVAMARSIILEAEALQRSAVLSITAAQSSAAESATGVDGGATARHSTAMAVFDMYSFYGRIPRICSCLNLFEAAACCAQATPAATAELQQELTVFWQSLEQQLLPQLQLAADIATYATAFHTPEPRSHRLALQHQLSGNPAVSELVGQLQTAGSAVARMRLLSSSFITQLPQKLKTAAQQLCALLPLPLCCNNPDCSNMSRQSELQLVGGKSCVCARCEVARYCGRECQAAHWQAHKMVCKMIKKSKKSSLATTAGTTGTPAAATVKNE